MLVAGITKVRNEEHLIQDTLDHFAEHCDAIFVYDDYSTDDTAELCFQHEAVKTVIKGGPLDANRERAEWQNRQAALAAAQIHSPEWILCFDADERVEMPEFDMNRHDAVKMKLFDFYITEEDVDLPYTERRWIGPEYREILMMYRNRKGMRFQYPDQRTMLLRGNQRILRDGYVRHYGKAISVEEWEKTCDYYAKWPKYAEKWKNRRGKAVHSKSDFDRPLILWEERDLYTPSPSATHPGGGCLVKGEA